MLLLLLLLLQLVLLEEELWCHVIKRRLIGFEGSDGVAGGWANG